MHAGETRELDGYIARKSPLGWVVFGAEEGSNTLDEKVMLLQLTQPMDLSQFWKTEEVGVRPFNCNCREAQYDLSPNDKQQFTTMWNACSKEGGAWVMPYPWQKSPENLPDNKGQCTAKLVSLEKRLKKEPEHVERYSRAVSDLVDKGFARLLTAEEETNYQGPIHYIPHHPVIRSHSKSTPIRIVFNSSSNFRLNECLNDYWHKGPDLLQNMFGVILRFREYKFEIVGDISKMFYRVKIPISDQHVHRFLWRNCETRKAKTYVLTTVTPGDKPASPMAIIALLKTAVDNENKFPQAAKVIQNDTYMDDICRSIASETDATRIMQEIDLLLNDGGFRVKEWTTNLTKEDDNSVFMLSEIDGQKVLGVVWEPGSDMLKYKVEPIELQKGAFLTKRKVLSGLSKVFDPIGFAGAFIIQGKMMMQKLWSRGIGWDEDIGADESKDWINFFDELSNLDGVSFPKCLIPEPDFAIKRVQLVTFCDASEQAFGAVCYVRIELNNEAVIVRFVAAKARVAPLKRLTIPRLELQAAVLGARLSSSVKKEMKTDISDCIFLSDSEISLCWIRGQSRLWKSFVSNRVAEIQTLSDPSDWYHVPGAHNVADQISRGIPTQKLNGVWRDGPSYLRLPQEEWPKSNPRANPSEVDKERKAEKMLLLAQEVDCVIDVSKFSSWRRLLRVTAYVFRFIANAKAKCCVHDGPLTADELKASEDYWLFEAQNRCMIKHVRRN